MNPNNPSVLSVKQAAKKYQIPVFLIVRAIRKGDLKGSKRFGEYYVAESDLIDYLNNGDAA